jgi:Ca2+-binding RTX toxin-like protein
MARLAIVIAALTLYLALAQGGHAATVTAIPWSDKFGPHTNVSVVAEAGERNDMTIEYEQSATRVRDTVPLQAGAGCALQPDSSVLCGDVAWALEVHAGDRDDRVEVHNCGAIRRLFGEAGDDTLISAGDRPAQFTGGDGDDRMVGSSGTDTFLEGASANGSDTMLGDAGDTVSYAKRVNNVHADLAGDADDGEAGEQDRIGTEVRILIGGAGHDLLQGSDGADLLVGSGGSDALFGRGGNDELEGGRRRSPETTNDRLHGGPGSDTLNGGGGNDLLRGGLGPDQLFGFYGRDVLYGGPGLDLMGGGLGNDRLRARDGLAEQIDCGGGWDRVRHDVIDFLATNCERHGRARVITP